MDWLALFFAVEMGILPSYNGVVGPMPEGNGVYDGVSFYSEATTEVEVAGTLFVGGSVYTHFWKGEDTHTFAPDEAVYGFWAGLRYGWVEVFWRHYCSHTVGPWMYAPEPYRVYSYDGIALRISNGR